VNGLSRVPRLARRHRWLVGLFILGIAAVGLWLVFRILPEATDPTWEQLQETRLLRICTDPSWPPFEFVDERSGQIVGFDVDLAERLAARLVPGACAEIIPVGFDGLYDALLAGRCDAVLSALPYEPMRTEDVAFSIAYFNAGLVLLAPEDTTDIQVLDDLLDRVVGVEWGFVPEGDTHQRDLLRNLGLRRYDTAEDTLRALHAGEV
jgi:ABC-type amino acid transport substrate-binding protein